MNQLLTLSKALDILNLLANQSSTMSVEDIATELQIPVSTTYRLIQTLEKYDYVKRHSRAAISLGTSFLTLARKVNADYDKQLREISLEPMTNLTTLTGETSILHVRSGYHSICVANVAPKSMIRFVAENYRSIPLHIGCSGIAILAFESDVIIQSVYNRIADPDVQHSLNLKLSKAKSDGYYISSEEFDPDSIGIGVPVFDKNHHIYASISIVGPAFRISRNSFSDYVDALKKASAEITSKMD